MESPPEAADGSPFGKYRLAGRLGAGGMGEVWKAWDPDLRRWVALKFLKHDDPDEIARFKREAQTAARLSHPNIAAIHEVGVADGRHFISMQFVDGKTLRAAGRDPRAIAALLRDAALAVHHAHELGIVHRDLKPDNLMIDGSGRLFVMDFGLAKQLSTRSSLSASGLLVGTPAYMAPEQARGDLRAVDARSDVYALGATLYELLAGRPPFEATDLYELLMKIVSDDPAPLGGDRDLAIIAAKCLQKDPARRYATARALAQDLSRWLDGEPIEARPESVAYRLRKRLAKRKAVVAVAALGLLATVAVAAVFVGRWRRAEAAREDAEFYLTRERDLDLLRMNFYRPDYSLTDREFASFDALAQSIETRMKARGESADGRYLLGRCREALSDLEAAESQFAAAVRLNPAHARALLARGRVAILRALLKQIVHSMHPDFRRAAASESADGVAWVRRGASIAGPEAGMELDLAVGYADVIRSGLERGNYDAREAMARWAGRPFVEEFLIVEGFSRQTLAESAAEMLKRMPSAYIAHFWLGVMANTRRRFDEAVGHHTRALAIHPRNVEALLLRAAARVETGDLSGADEDCARVLALRPGSIGAYLTRSNIRFASGDFAAAAAEAEAAIRIDPRFAGAYVNRGNARQRLHNLDGALEDYARALELTGPAVAALTGQGNVHVERKDWPAAIACFDRAISCAPDQPEPYTNRAFARRASGDPEGALRDYSTAVELQPGYAPGWAWRGDLKMTLGRYAEALDDYERALREDARLDIAWAGRGTARLHLGDPSAAVRDLSRATELTPRYASAWLNLGHALKYAGEPDRALEAYARSVEIDPSQADAHLGAGLIHLDRKDPALAQRAFDRAIELDPGAPDGYVNRAIARRKQRDFDGAIADCTRAIEIDPRLAEAYYNRANVHADKGDRDAAARDYLKVLEIAPDHPERENIRRLVDRLQKR